MVAVARERPRLPLGEAVATIGSSEPMVATDEGAVCTVYLNYLRQITALSLIRLSQFTLLWGEL